MDPTKKQELIIVNAISEITIPNDAFENSEFKEIISNYKEAQKKVSTSLNDVETARKRVKEGNFLGNWWHKRKDNLQDAQLDLNKSVGLLTKQSSDLILFNTAISKVLVSQQNVLHEQQKLLSEQASELDAQNKSIEEHQIKLSRQQEEIIKANNGLLEAKGLTRDQAEKLVGCVKRVEAAEQKMELSNQELEHSLSTRIVACERRAESYKAELDKGLYNYRQETALRLEKLNTEHNTATEGLRSQYSNLELKINAESESSKLALASAVEGFNQRIDELRNEQASTGEKLISKLESTNERLTSKIASSSSIFEKHQAEYAEKHKKLLYIFIAALIISGLSMATSTYVYLINQGS